MCPACLSTTALVLAGAGSGGLSALLAHRRWRTRKEDVMDEKTLPPPTFVDARPVRLAGLRRAYTLDRRHEIPGQWQVFGARWFGRVPGGVSAEAFGVSLRPAAGGDFDYLCGVEVAELAAVPPELDRLDVPAHRQARFVHGGHVSALPATVAAVMAWLPGSGLAIDEAAQPALPRITEWYGADFDPATGRGAMEVWVPVKG